MPPLPLKSITVAGHRVRIKIDPNLNDWAQFDIDEKLISVSLRAMEKEEFLNDTLRHELAHAALRLSGVSFAMSNEVEEAVVRCIEQIFLPALTKLNSRLQIKPATEPA